MRGEFFIAMEITFEDIAKARVCPYCGRKPVLTDSAEIYGGRSFGPIWLCRPCNAYVGCHQGTTTPKGRLADSLLRQAKKKAHCAFDPIWQTGLMKRQEAYDWLSRELGIPRDYTHIGMFDVDTCLRTVSLCERFLQLQSQQPHAVNH